MRKFFLVGAMTVAAMVGMVGESRAGCGLLSRLFGGGRGCGSSRPVVTAHGPACSAPAAYPVRHVVYSSPVPQQMPQYLPQYLPATNPDGCPGGNCPPRGTVSRFNPFR